MEFKIIIKKLNKSLSEDEKIIFDAWYNEAEKHKIYFESVKENYAKGLENIDEEKGWNVINKRISNKPRKIFYRKYAVAAAAILLLLIGTHFLSINNVITPDNNKVTIVTGTDKAVLTLEDGSNVVLEKGRSYADQNMSSNGQKLVYTTPSNRTTQIAYNYLTIPRGGQFFIKLGDGTKVWLNSESKLKYPVSFIKGEERQVELLYGEAYLDVSSSTNHKGSRFKIITKGQEVEVLGTEFNIKAYRDEKHMYTTLVEGKVTVTSADNFKTILEPNNQSIVDIENRKVTVVTVDVYNEIAWKEGVFSFERKSLKEIMKVLSRWYDVDITFENKELQDAKFIGVLGREQRIEEILLTIKNLGIINSYTISKTRIVLK